MIVKRVILLIAFIALVNAWDFLDIIGLGDSNDAQKNKRFDRNQKAQRARKIPQKISQKTKEEEKENEKNEAKDLVKDQEIVDNITPEDDLQKTDQQRHEAWERNLREFEPDDMFTFVIQGGTALVFHETIKHETPTTIKGAYIVHGSERNPVKPLQMLFVQDPIKNLIYSRRDEVQGMIEFNTTQPGEYTFIFANFENKFDQSVTMALHTFEPKEAPIEYDLIDNQRVKRGADPLELVLENLATNDEFYAISRNLKSMMRTANSIKVESKISSSRQEDHNQTMQANQDWFLKAMFLEVLCFIGVLAYQLSHLKKSLENKLLF